jgi:hypothetical protein
MVVITANQHKEPVGTVTAVLGCIDGVRRSVDRRRAVPGGEEDVRTVVVPRGGPLPGVR